MGALKYEDEAADSVGATLKHGDEIGETAAKHGDEIVAGAENLKSQNLMEELANSGVKYTPEDVIMVTKTPDGTLM